MKTKFKYNELNKLRNLRELGYDSTVDFAVERGLSTVWVENCEKDFMTGAITLTSLNRFAEELGWDIEINFVEKP